MAGTHLPAKLQRKRHQFGFTGWWGEAAKHFDHSIYEKACKRSNNTSHNNGDTFRIRNHHIISGFIWLCLPKLNRYGWNIGCTMDPHFFWVICVAAAKPYEAHHWLRIRQTVVLQTQVHCMLRPQKIVGCRIISMQINCNTLTVLM
jgi:hypothetical protein